MGPQRSSWGTACAVERAHERRAAPPSNGDEQDIGNDAATCFRARKPQDWRLNDLAGNVKWSDALTASFLAIANDPACDLWTESNDGSTALSLLTKCDAYAPNAQRQQLIAEFERASLLAQTPDPGERRTCMAL